MCFFQSEQNIFLKEKREFGIKNVIELTQYNITRKDYIFSYDYDSYLHNIEDIFIFITVPQTSKDYVGELEVINPLMQNFTYKYKSTQAIPLKKGTQVVSKGKYYFIFRKGTGVTFYLYNNIKFFPLDKINNFKSSIVGLYPYSERIFYFAMNLEEEKYIYLEWTNGDLYLYSLKDKTFEKQTTSIFHAYKIKAGSYIVIMDLNQYIGESLFSI